MQNIIFLVWAFKRVQFFLNNETTSNLNTLSFFLEGLHFITLYNVKVREQILTAMWAGDNGAPLRIKSVEAQSNNCKVQKQQQVSNVSYTYMYIKTLVYPYIKLSLYLQANYVNWW